MSQKPLLTWTSIATFSSNSGVSVLTYIWVNKKKLKKYMYMDEKQRTCENYILMLPHQCSHTLWG
jgi:uncharacterized protein YpiB (UPF0302 family)